MHRSLDYYQEQIDDLSALIDDLRERNRELQQQVRDLSETLQASQVNPDCQNRVYTPNETS